VEGHDEAGEQGEDDVAREDAPEGESLGVAAAVRPCAGSVPEGGRWWGIRCVV